MALIDSSDIATCPGPDIHQRQTLQFILHLDICQRNESQIVAVDEIQPRASPTAAVCR